MELLLGWVTVLKKMAGPARPGQRGVAGTVAPS
jgi:hypothetical protein